jgi:hypothetical protein
LKGSETTNGRKASFPKVNPPWRRFRNRGCNTDAPDYSIFDSAPNRMHDAKWLFPQEKATLHDVGDVNE